MTKSVVAYSIVNTVQNLDGSRLVYLTVTRTEKTTIVNPEDETQRVLADSIISTTATVYVAPGADQQTAIDAYMATNPI